MNVRDIIARHNGTFYRFDTEVKRCVWCRYLVISLLSLAYTLMIGHVPLDAKTNVITTFSILLGFGFSVIFFLGTENKTEKSHSIYLEDLELENRKASVRKELFYNVSYFNIISLCSIFFMILTMIKFRFDRIYYIENLEQFLDFYNFYAPLIGVFLVIFFCLESFYSFYWVLRKVTYLFDKKFGT